MVIDGEHPRWQRMTSDDVVLSSVSMEQPNKYDNTGTHVHSGGRSRVKKCPGHAYRTGLTSHQTRISGKVLWNACTALEILTELEKWPKGQFQPSLPLVSTFASSLPGFRVTYWNARVWQLWRWIVWDMLIPVCILLYCPLCGVFHLWIQPLTCVPLERVSLGHPCVLNFHSLLHNSWTSVLVDDHTADVKK